MISVCGLGLILVCAFTFLLYDPDEKWRTYYEVGDYQVIEYDFQSENSWPDPTYHYSVHGKF